MPSHIWSHALSVLHPFLPYLASRHILLLSGAASQPPARLVRTCALQEPQLLLHSRSRQTDKFQSFISDSSPPRMLCGWLISPFH
ncbi:hypothetical protein BS17DRAFT_779644 [Gyrodon lividus]|nr:hypothetical protein BS17DRAFT_779644 [Gyrodon lividus]